MEELALTLNGKKRKFKRNDFDLFTEKLLIPKKAAENVYEHLHSAIPKMLECIDISFLDKELKEDYKMLIQERANRLY
jgi:serine/threonine-protein kinase HipA